MNELAAAVVWAAQVIVQGSSDCPTPGEVATRVEALVPPAGRPVGVAELSSAGPDLRLVLRDGAGALAGERRLPRADLGCGELATAAATVIATWASDVHPEFAPPAAAAATVSAAAAARASRSNLGFTAALGLLGSLAPEGDDAGWAAGAVVAGAVHRGPLGGRLALAFQTERSFPVGTGRALTRRWVASLGPVHRLDEGTGPVRVEVGAAAVASWLTVRGTGFARDLSEDGEADLGAAGSVAVALRRKGPFTPFAELGGTWWARPRSAVDLATGARRALPRLEASLTLGILSRAL